MTVNKLEPDSGTPNDERFAVAGMFDGSLYRLLLRMALPMFVGMLTQVTYAIADIFWLSHIDVANSGIIAGVGLIFPVGMGLFAIANGIQIGMGSLLSRTIGMQRLDRAQQILSVGITIALFFAVVIAVLGYVYAQPLLRALGATESIIGYAADFYYYSLPTVFSIMLIGVMMGLFQGAGKIMVIMKASLLGALVNIVLDPIMIFVFDFGVKGVALASLLAQLSVVVYFLYALMGLRLGLSVRIALRPFSWQTYREFLSVGLAQMLMQLIISIGIVIYNFFIVRLDVNAMAAFTLTGRIDYFIMTPMLAIAAALLTVVGQNWGRGNVTRTLDAYWAAVALAFSIVLVLAVAHIVLAPWIYPLFTHVGAVSDYAVLQTRIMALALPFIAVSMLASEYYQAIAKPWYSVLLTLMRHVFISVPAVYLLAFVLDMRITGVYFGAMSGTFVAASLAWRLLRISPRLLRWNQETVRAQHPDMEVAP